MRERVDVFLRAEQHTTLSGCHGDGESAKLDAHRPAFSGGLYPRALEQVVPIVCG